MIEGATTAPAGARTVLVAVKHVPAGGAFLRIDGQQLTRAGVSHGLDPLNEVAVEWALRTRERGAADRVVVTTMGPPAAVDTLRRALAIGADDAVLVSDEALAGADVRVTARALAGVARHVRADLLLTGYESVDGSSGAVPSATAALLGWPLVSRFGDGRLDALVLSGIRDLGTGAESVQVDLPAVVSFVEGHVAPRYPKLKDIVRTKGAQPLRLSSDALRITYPSETETVVGLVEVPQPPKQARVVAFDEGVDELLALLLKAGSHGG